MTVWKKLDQDECYAVAIYNYSGGGAEGAAPHLELEVGELVRVERECAHWYWGRRLRRARAAPGLFPKSYVRVRDFYTEQVAAEAAAGEEAADCAGGAGLAHDIALTVRDWLERWKRLYLTNEEQFKFIEVSMRTLLELRAQATSGALPQDQLRRLRRTAVFTIDKGNRALGAELTVRDRALRPVDPLRVSAAELAALSHETEARVGRNVEPAAGARAAGTAPRCHSVLVALKNFPCKMSEEAELLVSLYDAGAAGAPRQLTEHYAVRWSSRGLPRDVDNVHNMNVLFTDLGLCDIKLEKVFLVCFVVRVGAMEPQVDNRRSSMASGGGGGGARGAGVMRRPFGVACADITRALQAPHADKQHCVPFYPCEKENLDSLLRKIVTNRELKPDTKNTMGLWITLRLLHGDPQQIRAESPHLVVGSVSVARKIGFPEVIVPGDARNDLYVRLVSGAFGRGGGKPSERNLELSARLVGSDGRALPAAISVGAGLPLVSEYTSLVHYHDDRPKWQEVFKVCLSIEQFKEAHLVVLCRHRSSNEAKDKAEKHFALSYLRLMHQDGTAIHDAEHSLCVYKLDTKRWPGAEGEAEAARCCLALPARREDLPREAERGLTRGPLSLLYKDSLVVATHLCSTKLTYREEILGVLKWNARLEEGALRSSLRQLLAVPSEEVVKFLQDILDALFNILTQVEEEENPKDGEESYGELTLSCLLKVMSLVTDHKYQHFQPLLDVYIDKSFCNTLVYERLLVLVRETVARAEAGEAAQRRLLQCMKCLEYLVRFAVRSCELRAALGDAAAERAFRRRFRELCEALEWLMRCGEAALLCQGSCLKYLPHALPHALRAYPPPDAAAAAVALLAALPPARLATQRVLALQELARGPLFAAGAARARLLPALADTLRRLLRDHHESAAGAESRGKNRSVDKVARVLGTERRALEEYSRPDDLLELCVATLSEVSSRLLREEPPDERSRGELARELLPAVLRAAAAAERDRAPDAAADALPRQLVSVLLDMVRRLTEDQYCAVMESVGGRTEHRDLLLEALALVQALLARPVYAAHWADMLHLQAHALLHFLELMSTSLTRCALAPLDKRVWRAWFRCCVTCATLPALQPAALSGPARRRLLQRYGDPRRVAASLLQRLWFKLDDDKRAFIPSTVGPFLEVSLLPDEEVREATIPLFFDMMQTEFHDDDDPPPGAGLNSHFDKFENELIDKLDVLVEGGRGDEAWRATFVSMVGALCSGHESAALRDAGLALVAAVGRQLDTLLQYRAGAGPDRHHHRQLRMHLTTRVLRLYDSIERQHMYIRYVHKLAALHAARRQWAEAGLALRLHAKLLSWADRPLERRLRPPPASASAHPSAATHRTLKEALYLDVVNYLHQGKMWELAVEVVKELVHVFEDEALGYRPLMEMHLQLHKLYKAALETPRGHPGYFRVVHRGHRDLETPHGFVYRGEEYELLPDFSARMLAEWPDAELLHTLDAPPPDSLQPGVHYMQINAVEPLMCSSLKRLSGRAVPDEILQHYKHNNVQRFMFSRPVIRQEESADEGDGDSGPNEFASRWLERTEIEISDKLPGILRWFPVVSSRTYPVSPLEVALETMRETNRELRRLVVRHGRRADLPLDPLTRKLHGIVDAAVMGGVVNYERAFLAPAYARRRPEHAPLLTELRDLIADQVPLLEAGLDVHGRLAPPALQALHAHLLQRFAHMRDHVHRQYGRKSCDLELEMPEVNLRRSTLLHADEPPAPAAVPNGDHRLSDATNGTPKRTIFTSLNQLTRYSTPGGAGGAAGGVLQFGTMQPGKRRDKDKRRARRMQSEVGASPAASSQWYTGVAAPPAPAPAAGPAAGSPYGSCGSIDSAEPSTPGSADAPTPSPSPLRELRQELSASRPLRAEAERERRLSQRPLSVQSAADSNRNSLGTTDSNQDEEEAPPLPAKARAADREEDAPAPAPGPRYSYDTVYSPRGSFLYASLQGPRPRRAAADARAPTPPPKRRQRRD